MFKYFFRKRERRIKSEEKKGATLAVKSAMRSVEIESTLSSSCPVLCACPVPEIVLAIIVYIYFSICEEISDTENGLKSFSCYFDP